MIQRVAILCLVALAMAPGALAGGMRPRSRRQQEDIPEIRVAVSPSSFKVKIDLYYMPQCPGCRQLISGSISEAFQTAGFSDMADVHFKPWGRKHQEDGHPQGRIFDNVLESCVLQEIGNQHQDTQFMYIECIDRSRVSNALAVDRSCAKAVGLDESRIKDIEECAVSKAGHDLADKYLKESDAMDMAYAPWIVVNGKHSKEQEDQIWHSLFYYVCELYKGPYRSSECPSEDMMVEQL